MLRAIAVHLKSEFLCTGSFPAFVITKEISVLTRDEEIPKLNDNDIDIYRGSFGD